MATNLIGLGHQLRQGKDSVATAIIESRGHEFDIRRYAFGDAIKREVNDAALEAGGMFALFQQIIRVHPTADIIHDPDPDMTDPLCPLGKQRSILQWWGNEYRRARDAFYWIKQIKRQIAQDRPQFAIITDVRFVNEYALVKSTGGTAIKVTREGFGDIDLSLRRHVSETELSHAIWDYEIAVQDGDLAGLKSDAVETFDMIVSFMTENFNVFKEEYATAT